MAMQAFEPTSRPASVLLVDDDPLVLRSLARTLGSSGVNVISVDDPQKALKVLANEDLDCVICDIRMPEMSGLTFAKFVRAQQPDVPMVLMTGDPGLDTALEAIDLGILEYLAKPLEPPKLRDTVNRAIKLRRLARVRDEAARVVATDAPPPWREAQIAASFERALATMFVVFQPIVDFRAKKVFGYEALLRSREPSLPTPPDFIDAAQRLGRGQELARLIRERAVTELMRGPAGVNLFLNVQPGDLEDDMLYDARSPLAEAASRVVLEITERSNLAQVKDILARIARLRKLGYRIAIDDLGAGYAGLSSFAALEPELTKLDMSIVRGIDASPVKRRVVGSMVALCRDLGSRVVAEGVETREERAALADLGCELMQGYLFAKPAPPFPEVAW